jgi:hypothetical protein
MIGSPCALGKLAMQAGAIVAATARAREGERRRHERIPLAIPVFVRGQDADGNDFLEFATALNISSGGALLATRRQLSRLARIFLEIPSAPVPRIPGYPKPVRRIRARLLRHTSNEGIHLSAIKFSARLHTDCFWERKVASLR